MSKKRLGVNIDHVATLRQARHTPYPEPVVIAGIAELAGADQITVHLREDRRHIQDRDVKILRQTISTSLNLEMSMAPEIVDIACAIKPDIVTLVPERREELTTEGGLNLERYLEQLKKPIQKLQDTGIRVSLFIDPELSQIKIAHRLGVKNIELHTGKYAEAKNPQAAATELENLRLAARLAHKLELEVAAGHGLHYHNIQPLLSIEEILEYNIGHSIVARALFVGFKKAVKEMVSLLHG